MTQEKYSNHPKQRGATHLWFSQCADVLNAQGVTVSVVVELLEKYGVSWTGAAVKELVYKPILKAQKELDSTEDQLTSDVEDTRKEMILLLGERLGVVLPPFPDRFSLGKED